MRKQLFEITNTRFLWTLTHYLNDCNTNQSCISIEALRELAFSHGARDAETYRREKRGHTYVQLKECCSFIKLEGINNLEDKNIKGVKISDEIIQFLKDEKKLFKFYGEGLETINSFKEEYFNNREYHEILKISIQNSIFLPILSGGSARVDENKQIHEVGFEYTRNYLKGFFFGIYLYLNRDPITGSYFRGEGFDCYYNGYINNSFVFTFCTEIIGFRENRSKTFNNQMLIGEFDKENFYIFNTRFIWSIRRLTLFEGNSTKVSEKFINVKSILEKISFSHGARDYLTFIETSKPEIKTIMDFFEEKNVFKCNIVEIGNQRYQIEIRDGTENCKPYQESLNIFLPHLSRGNLEMYESLPKKTKMTYEEFYNAKDRENKEIHNVGFIYTKNYILGFFHGFLINQERYKITGYFVNSQKLDCYYIGYIKNSFNFVVCQPDNTMNNAIFDNSMLLL